MTFIQFLMQLGITIEDTPEIRLRKSTTVIIVIICCFIAPFWIWIYCSLGMLVPAFGPILYLIFILPAFVYYCFTKKEIFLVNVQLISNLLLPVFMQWTLGGVSSGNIVIVWSFMSPLFALLFHDLKKAKTLMAVLILFFILTGLLDSQIRQWSYEMSYSVRLTVLVMNLIGPLIVVYFTMQYFVKTINENGELLKIEKQKSDSLLENILPAEVAEELKEKGSAKAKLFNDVTVLFTDFKGFTKVAERLSPQQLVDELHNCFKVFDGIMGKYGIEKIKTVGDAYLAASGLPAANANHAENIVRAAQEIRGFMEDRKKELGEKTFEIRIGIHSGSAVAGIVGVRKFAYDIWGDTVNTAARMEQNSEAGKINISQSTYELVKDKFCCKYRGEIEAKNKGLLKMYFVE